MAVDWNLWKLAKLEIWGSEDKKVKLSKIGKLVIKDV